MVARTSRCPIKSVSPLSEDGAWCGVRWRNPSSPTTAGCGAANSAPYAAKSITGSAGAPNICLTYNANGDLTNVVRSNGITDAVTYTSFDLPDTMTRTASKGTTTYLYRYDPDHARVKLSVTAPTGNYTSYYLGGYEKDVRAAVTEHKHYIAGAGVYITKST